MTFAVRRWLWPKSLFGKAGVVFLVAGLLLILTWLVAIAVTEWRLAEALKVSEAEFGMPNSIAELLGPPSPPEKNAAVAIDDAARLMHNWLDESIKRVGDVGVAHQFDADATLQTQVMGPELDALLSEADRRIAYVSRAPKSPWYDPVSPPLQWRRMIPWAEVYASQRLEQQGKSDEAVGRLLRCLRVSRKWIGREPNIFEVRENLSEQWPIFERLNEMLRRRKFPAALHDEIDAELAGQATIRDVLAFQYQFEKLQRLDAFADHPGRQSLWWMIRPIANNDRLYILHHYNSLLRSSKRPFHEVNVGLRNLAEEHSRIEKDRWESQLHPESRTFTTSETHIHYDVHEVHVRCLRIVNALAKCGDWSTPLESLGLPEECLIDLYSGGRIKVKMKPAGPVVYSVGADLRDDGGDVTFKRDSGYGPEDPLIKFP